MPLSVGLKLTIVGYTTCLLAVEAASSPMPQIYRQYGPSSTKQFTSNRTYWVQVAGACCAAASMATSCVAFFWFCRMEKRFRHRLIILLIYGDMIKTMWIFAFALASITRGTIYTESPFCQASGFLVQYGTETSDYAVLAIAVHSAMQVFRPSNTVRSDGLYPYRYPLFLGAFLIPLLMAGLAFAGDHHGYMSQGAFCSLPLRPFWYRLALTWVPRYVIAIIILGLAVAIYAHVGFEFRSLSNMLQNEKPSVSSTTILSTNDQNLGDGASPDLTEHTLFPARRGSSIVSILEASRRASAAASTSMYSESNDTAGSIFVPSGPHSARRSSAFTILAGPVDTCSQLDNTNTSRKASNTVLSASDDNHASPLSTSTPCAPPTDTAQRNLAQQRMRIHRQLRLMFVYPICYIIMWLIPFTNHCMMYYEDWATHPLYWLVVASTICYGSMGMVDCLIFTLRERPWRHIPNSDGTFLGSFAWWRTFSGSSSSSLLPSRAVSTSGTVASTLRPRPTDTLHRTVTEVNPTSPNSGPPRNFGVFSSVMDKGREWRSGAGGGNGGCGGGDHAKGQARFARMRLEAEKEERRAAFQGLGRRQSLG
ncbi:unnamed protein product [Periconia digitata]|uniref:Uncharacterized protein n=1 Tax=Periconia digitata TaxID=1303443 RepID=A0A9W4U659_9PLEO|nr:unnamed protein product [Periconia digitata]